MGTAGIFGGWAPQGYLVVEHCRGYFAVGQWKDILRLGTADILCGWPLQTYSTAGHCRDILQLGIAGILCGSALQGYSAVGHCRDTL